MEATIKQALEEVQREYGVRVLYACESGSRAWGFASVDSDYDVRFIYVHPPDWYTSIVDRRDVIERMLPNDLDVSGWELRKALRLFRKCNPAMMEWVRSPIVYSSDERFLEDLKAVPWEPTLGTKGWPFSPERCFRHYLSMARGNIRNYFDTDIVPLKKYLYVIRPLLACKWICDFGTLPPVEFKQLVDRTVADADLKAAIDQLLGAKRSATELGTGPKIPALSRYMESQFARLTSIEALPHAEPHLPALNELFRRSVGF